MHTTISVTEVTEKPLPREYVIRTERSGGGRLLSSTIGQRVIVQGVYDDVYVELPNMLYMSKNELQECIRLIEENGG